LKLQKDTPLMQKDPTYV